MKHKAEKVITDMASKYMHKSFVKGFRTAIECIETDIETTAVVHKKETLTSLTKRLEKALVLYKEDNEKDNK